MYRLFLFVVVMLLAVGCGSENGESGHDHESASTPGETSTPPPAAGSGRAAIPEAIAPATETEGLAINLYGDLTGKVTSLQVTPGKMFEVYLLLENETTDRIAALQYRLLLPENVSLVAEQRIKEDALIIGGSESNISIAFKCVDPGVLGVMKYIIQPAEGFTGGTIYVAEATDADMTMFRGVATCPTDGEQIKLPVAGGSLELTVE
jgi:hypothetical protein